MRTLLPIALLALLPALSASTTSAQGASDTIVHLHGSVLNGATGRPLGRALVVSADRRLATMTDSEGHWALDVSVPAPVSGDTAAVAGRMSVGVINGSLGGALILTAQRPHFLISTDQTPVALDASASEQAIVLRLYPGATVQGIASARGHDTTRGMSIALLHRMVMNGRSVWTPAGTRQVDADGLFRFSDLYPGEYTVMTDEWNPDRTNAEVMSGPTEGYPPVFLGGGPTLATATKLHLGYGETVQANLRAEAATYFPVTVPVQVDGPNRGLSVEVTRGDSFNGYRLGWNPKESRVEGALPSGDYLLGLASFNKTRQSAQVELHVAGGRVQTAPVTLGPALTIPVRVHDERTLDSNAAVAQQPNNTRSRNAGQDFYLFLRPLAIGNGQNGGGMTTREGAPAVENMVPGTYFLEASAARGYIASATSGGVDLLQQPLVVGAAGADPIDLTLRDGGGTVQGTVEGLAEHGRFIAVLLLPSGPGGIPQQTMVGTWGFMYGAALRGGTGSVTATANSFQFNHVPPGSYRVLALIQTSMMDGIAYREPDSLRAYDGKGQSITVSAGQTSQVAVSATPVAGLGVQR